ncbi:MAG: tyrosinase family protein [Thaumarchaeota archaeon]|nr:MAG: tyrosinase family protein [Nitrososphaerota archaeon]
MATRIILRVETINMSLNRLNLSSVPPSDRQQLANLCLQFVTEGFLQEHENWHRRALADPGVHIREFFSFHRQMIQNLESFLNANGAGAYVPIPYWDPAERIPAEFTIVLSGFDPLRNPGPIAQIDSWFIPPDVCRFQTEGQLANSILAFHNFVHNTVGGVMSQFNSPAAAIFYPWHATIDLIYSNWQQC